ncbi:MAG: ABC transporter permease [Acutalibacteraceae bacterium]
MTRKGTAVTTIIARCLPATMKLGLVAFIIAITVGVTLGIVAAFTKRKWVENLVMFVATIGISVPSFLYAMLLMIVFGVVLGWLPIIGLKTPLHYIMPAFSLALYPISMITRLVRSSMKEVMKQDYIVLARSKGTPMIKVILGHALKNCLIPVVTYAGPLLAFLITGSFVIESLFSIPGIGSEFVNSVTNRDYTMIMALTILFGSFIIIVNILTDLLVAFIDPRVKLEKKAS